MSTQTKSTDRSQVQHSYRHVRIKPLLSLPPSSPPPIPSKHCAHSSMNFQHSSAPGEWVRFSLHFHLYTDINNTFLFCHCLLCSICCSFSFLLFLFPHSLPFIVSSLGSVAARLHWYQTAKINLVYCSLLSPMCLFLLLFIPPFLCFALEEDHY